MSRKVGFTPEAQSDLVNLENYIAAQSGIERAISCSERLYDYCMSLADFGERGVRREDLRPGLRIVGFEKRVAIAFHLTADMVVIDRVLYGRRYLEAALSDDV